MNSVDDTSAHLGTSDGLHGEDQSTLLIFVLDTSPSAWAGLSSQISFKEVVECMLIYINAHLSFNNLNTVAVLAAHTSGAHYLHPALNSGKSGSSSAVSSTSQSNSHSTHSSRIANGTTMYRQFREVNDTVLGQLNRLLGPNALKDENSSVSNGSSTNSGAKIGGNNYYSHSSSAISGALSLALSYISKAHEKHKSARFGARILLLSASGDISSQYIPTMNCIFAAQKMKVPIDVCKLGGDTVFLQQAADSTNGSYIKVDHPSGLMQYLLSAFMVEPAMRKHVVLPTQTDVDFKAACFVSKSVVDIGYVCSVCLCIMKDIPMLGQCPMCQTEYDNKALANLRKVPVVVVRKRAKKKKLDGTPTPTPA